MKKVQFILSMIIFCYLAMSPDLLMAQMEETGETPDTSYFRSGNDDLSLLLAVMRDDYPSTKLLIERGADVNTLSYEKNSPLMYAVDNQNEDIVRLLVENGAEVNFSGFNGDTPLLVSVLYNNFELSQYLLEKEADPNIKDDYGVNPLLYAAANNNFQLVDLLLFYGADKNTSDKDGNDALMTAVTFDNIETTDVLLQNEFDPDTRDMKGNTPLMVASQRGNHGIMELLLEYGAEVNKTNQRDYTALAYAVSFEDKESVKILLDNGADVNHDTGNGKNIAELARSTGNREILEMITEAGGTMKKGPDFSEITFSFANSFNSTDYLMQSRVGISDTRLGFFFETGIDHRPFVTKIERTINDTIFQFREKRIGWSHGFGKYFNLTPPNDPLNIAIYVSATGYMSFPRYAGTDKAPFLTYDLIPAAGFALRSRYFGVRFGAEYYDFESTLDKGLKLNVGVIVKFATHQSVYDRKEINW